MLSRFKKLVRGTFIGDECRDGRTGAEPSNLHRPTAICASIHSAIHRYNMIRVTEYFVQ